MYKKIGCMMYVRLSALFWGNRFSPPELHPGSQGTHQPAETVIMLVLN